MQDGPKSYKLARVENIDIVSYSIVRGHVDIIVYIISSVVWVRQEAGYLPG